MNSVFNYPTLAECYKTAALDGLNRLDSWQTAVTRPPLRVVSQTE